MDKSTNTISLVIPVLNESATLRGVLDAALASGVDEIIVVDDGSSDDSCAIAEERALRSPEKIRIVKNQTIKGPGGARRTGIQKARGGILAFLDADIKNPSPRMIRPLVDPIIAGTADFVMGSFDNVGRVTELTAKPLLAVCFPALAHLSQPISGQFAAKKEFLFPDRIEDGNAMLGVLIDAYCAGARIGEANIGPLVHAKRDLPIKQQQAIAECAACIKRFIESNTVSRYAGVVDG